MFKEFVNNIYNATDVEISGYHKDTPFLGRIIHTRCKYGADISVHVEDKDNNDIYVINGRALYEGQDSTYKNLHVYFYF